MLPQEHSSVENTIPRNLSIENQAINNPFYPYFIISRFIKSNLELTQYSHYISMKVNVYLHTKNR